MERHRVYEAVHALSFLLVISGLIAFYKCSSRDTATEAEFHRLDIPTSETYAGSEYMRHLGYKFLDYKK